ncbi:MAG: PqqD family protein [Smithella sp.]|nr:PqqD family protein [Smithella sp.]
MKIKIQSDAIYAASDSVVVRLVENQIVLFSVESDKNDANNEPYFLNTTGQIIWQKLDGRTRLNTVVKALSAEFRTPVKVIEKDVLAFVKMMVEKKMLVMVSGA